MQYTIHIPLSVEGQSAELITPRPTFDYAPDKINHRNRIRPWVIVPVQVVGGWVT